MNLFGRTAESETPVMVGIVATAEAEVVRTEDLEETP